MRKLRRTILLSSSLSRPLIFSAAYALIDPDTTGACIHGTVGPRIDRQDRTMTVSVTNTFVSPVLTSLQLTPAFVLLNTPPVNDPA